MGNGYPSLALAWNATNTLILGRLRRDRLAGRPPRPTPPPRRRSAPRATAARDRPRPHLPEVSHDLGQPHPTARGHARRARHRRPGDLPAQREHGGRRERLRADPRQDLRRRHAVRGPRRRPAGRRRATPCTTGQPLFVIDSASLQYDVKNGFAAPATEATQIDDEGRLVVLATGDGIVTDIAAPSAAPSSSRPPSWRPCSARTRCTCRRSTRSRRRSTRGWRTTPPVTVVLPNQRTITAHVSEVQVETVAGEAQAVMTVTRCRAQGRRAERARVRRHAGDGRAAPAQRRGGDADRDSVKSLPRRDSSDDDRRDRAHDRGPPAAHDRRRRSADRRPARPSRRRGRGARDRRAVVGRRPAPAGDDGAGSAPARTSSGPPDADACRRSTPRRSSRRSRPRRSPRSTRCASRTAWCRPPTAGTAAWCSATSRSRCSPSRCRSALTDSGFTLGLPAPTVDAKTIIAPHVPAVTVDAGAASAQVSAADPVSVTIELLDASGAVLGHVVLAEGSPFVSFTAAQDVTLSSTVTGGAFEPGDDGARDRRRRDLAVGPRRRRRPTAARRR